MSLHQDDVITSSDPAFYVHSEPSATERDALWAESFSSDLREVNKYLADVREQKTRDKIVIQNRAWKTSDAFRSDETGLAETPSRPSQCRRIEEEQLLPSSPPAPNMDLASVPLGYGSPSSPTGTASKRRKLSDDRPALKEVNANARYGGFVQEFSDEEDEAPEMLYHKQVAARTQEMEEADGASLEAMAITSKHASIFDEPEDPTGKALDSAYASDEQPGDTTFENQAKVPERKDPQERTLLMAQTCSGRAIYVGERRRWAAQSYQDLIASRSTHVEGHAKRSYYGIEIHRLHDEVASLSKVKVALADGRENISPSVERLAPATKAGRHTRTLMWTEKYRARKFTDLVGDERTHRSVLRWLKGWDSIVFPGAGKKQLLSKKQLEQKESHTQRKILLLTGPPGLGKTTLAHVCAKQAGYEVQEINASDERSSNVVRTRIRDMLGTENVRGHNVETAAGKSRKAGRPVCVIVDEVDGVVGGSGASGEGGFVKALIDLINLDTKNSSIAAMGSSAPTRKRKGDKFRMLRPLILVCNDVYHPSLRPLRQGSMAEIIYMRKPNINMVINRVHSIFELEGIPCDVDGARRLCEATWGVSTKKEGGTGSGTGEGDIRSVMVVGEWVAAKLRASSGPTYTVCQRLTRKWLEANILSDLGHDGGSARSLGRGGAKEVTERVFLEGAGFPKANPSAAKADAQAALNKDGTVGVAEASKRQATSRLRQMIDTSGEIDRILTDCFTTYPSQPIHDDTFLSKPNAAYEWLNFHDMVSSQLGSSQDWELAPYMSAPILGFHHLFATSQVARHTFGGQSHRHQDGDEELNMPFSGPAAHFTALETTKVNAATIATLQASLSLPLARMYRSQGDIASELLPYTLRMLSPDVRPVVINTSSAGAKAAPTASVRKASEKALVARAVECMAATGVRFEKSRVENEMAINKSVAGGWVYRMEPPLDVLGSYETLGPCSEGGGVRYAVRQVLEMEWRRENLRKGEETMMRKMAGDLTPVGVEGLGEGRKGVGEMIAAKKAAVKRDFFGRLIKSEPKDSSTAVTSSKSNQQGKRDEKMVWVSYREGFSNAVKKTITLKELMDGF